MGNKYLSLILILSYIIMFHKLPGKQVLGSFKHHMKNNESNYHFSSQKIILRKPINLKRDNFTGYCSLHRSLSIYLQTRISPQRSFLKSNCTDVESLHVHLRCDYRCTLPRFHKVCENVMIYLKCALYALCDTTIKSRKKSRYRRQEDIDENSKEDGDVYKTESGTPTTVALTPRNDANNPATFCFDATTCPLYLVSDTNISYPNHYNTFEIADGFYSEKSLSVNYIPLKKIILILTTLLLMKS